MAINHNFKKRFGQNFLTDKNLLSSIVRDAEISKTDTVIEIGAGAGALTRPLSDAAKMVYSFEIDKDLEPVLLEEFKEESNVKLIFRDFLELGEDEILKLTNGEYKVVANLPYYITTPIISKLLELSVPPKSITVMVQKEVAYRLAANEKSSSYGYFSAYLSYFGKVKILREVSRKMFTPSPNVDSAIVKIDVNNSSIDKGFVTFLKNVFRMKRKTLLNNISSSYNISKDEVIKRFSQTKYSETARADQLSSTDLYEIYKLIIK